MALSGLEIFKLLPKTNCGDCGVPTCMAFAMKLAQKKAELAACPHVSADAKAILGASSEPPIRLVKIGGSTPLEIGNETVMFRHEKTFVHPTGIAVMLRTSEKEAEILSRIQEFEDLAIERLGEKLRTDLYFIVHDSEDKADLLQCLEVVKSHSGKGIILDCAHDDVRAEALGLLRGLRPALYLRKEVTDKDIDLAKEFQASLILSAPDLSRLAGQAEKASQAGVKDLILNLESKNIGDGLQANTIVRRMALKKNFKAFGYPLLSFLDGSDEFDVMARASTLLCKYASIVVLPRTDPAMLYALFTLRQNIYTDPQKPIQVEPKIYPIGDPGPESPIFVTTNFSLTYFIVAGEIENAGASAHLVVCDTEGQSVLTSWAAGKFVPERIAKFIKETKIEESVKTRKVVIPGFVSQISGELEEKMPGWEVIVGPQEAADIPTFIKNVALT